MTFLKPLERLQLSGDIAKNWRLSKQKFELFLTASVPDGKPLPTPARTALLLSMLSVAGDDALEVYNNFAFSADEDRQDYTTIVGKFDVYFAAQLNEAHERYLFCRRVQAQGEPVEQFIRNLRQLAQSCNFNTMTDSMIRDQIIFGTGNDKVREKLLRDNTRTLVKAEQTCKAAKLTACTERALGKRATC
ncbi:unnamed protein product [Ixodes hexagonus]